MDLNATREILWNIPASYKICMYVLFVFTSLLLVKTIYDKFCYILNGRSFQDLLPSSRNFQGLPLWNILTCLEWKSFFKTLLLQGKVPRRKGMGLTHGLIFYGFMILWIATDLVAIHYDTPFKIFKGPVYIIVSFLADWGGFGLLVGLCLAYKRRYVDKPSYLSATKPKQELYMYGMLANLVIVGFIIEGIRIFATDVYHGSNALEVEKWYAPIGWCIAQFFSFLQVKYEITQETFSNSYRYLWMFHMVSTMVFVASIGLTKFSHILFAPFSALITPKRRGAIFSPMNFEAEGEVESFGLSKLTELTAKQSFDLEVCVECGRCTSSCPANGADKPLNPKTIITKMRDFRATQLPTSTDGGENFWEKQLYSANELDSCTMCGACMEECPVNIEHVSIIKDLKRYKALTLGDMPPSAADAVNKIRNNGNPWGISHEDRFNWASSMPAEMNIGSKIIQEQKHVDYLYYVGCAGSFDAGNQKVVKDTLMLLSKANVDFALMGKGEKCNGDPIRRFGDEYTFNEIALENIREWRKYSFNKIVTHCPHCLHTIGKEYASLPEGKFEVIHHTELLWDLVKSGKLSMEKAKPIDELRTFHDPCFLGRHHGEYNAPRNLLESIRGIELKEMERSKDKSLCCGMGGGNMWYEIEEGHHLSHNRLKDVAQVKVEKLSTACSFCLINFNSAKGQVDGTSNLEVEDVACTLARSIL